MTTRTASCAGVTSSYSSRWQPGCPRKQQGSMNALGVSCKTGPTVRLSRSRSLLRRQQGVVRVRRRQEARCPTCAVAKPMEASKARDWSETCRRCHLERAEERWWWEAFGSPLWNAATPCSSSRRTYLHTGTRFVNK